MVEFEVSDYADQKFAVTLNGRRVTMRLRFNYVSNRWSFDLSIDDLPVLHGRRVVAGVDLLKPFNLGLGIIFAMAIVEGALPDRVALPNGSVKIFHATEEDVELAETL